MVGCVGKGEGGTRINHGAGNARLVQLKSGCPGPCFFLVPGTGGRIEGFADLASLLQTSMPVYAIEARGVDGSSEPDSDLEEMVKHYVNRVQTVQAAGPYFLLGHSFGGMIVFEMAQRLRAAGERVACLILLDTSLPKRYWPLKFWLKNIGARLQDHVTRLRTLPLKQSGVYYSRRVLRRIYGLEDIPADLKIGRDIARVLLANDMVGKRWRPNFYSDRLTLFSSTNVKGLETLWRSRVQELDVHSAAGGHVNLIERPYVSSLAVDISACLMRASSQ
jgi:acetoacetyl-CoA synthetase